MPQQTPQAIAPGRTVTVWEVEDDAALAGTVAEYLTLRGCEVRAFGSADAARQALLARRPDLVLPDWNLPDGGGDALCRWLRQRWPGLPVIFLTVRDDARDIVAGLEAGGDDYLIKPFLLEVLAGRIRAVLRRTLGEAGSLLRCDEIRLDTEQAAVWQGERPVALTGAEYRLLLLLLQNKGRTLTRARLLEQLWDAQGSFVGDNTLTVTVKRLREKLSDPPCLKTVRSLGYRMEDTE